MAVTLQMAEAHKFDIKYSHHWDTHSESDKKDYVPRISSLEEHFINKQD